MSLYISSRASKACFLGTFQPPFMITRRGPGVVEPALATWSITKSLICRVPAAGGDRTDPAERPEDALRLLALCEGDREDVASANGRFAAGLVAAFVAGFGASPEEASKSHWKGVNNVSTQQICRFLYFKS